MHYPTKNEIGQLNKHVVIAPSGRRCVSGNVWRERRRGKLSVVCAELREGFDTSTQPNAL